MDCSVCCERITKKTNVTCHFCDYVSCKSCAKRFLLDSVNPSCMNCKKPWNRETLCENFGKTFVDKEYKQKRERDLFETEKALLPQAQEIATREKRIKGITREIYMLQERIRNLKQEKLYLEAGVTKSSGARGHKIKCPLEACRGFVDSSDHICGTCETEICKDCHAPLKQTHGSGDKAGALEHTCDPDTLETIRLLKKDTKNCPKCAVGIHKIEGCDQMYCTQCHTAFSWRTGEIVIGERIHNPHYFEYLRRTGAAPREIGDIPCGGLPGDWEMRPFFRNQPIMNAFRNCVHIEQVEFRNYRTDRVTNNLDLRIKYLNNEITEAQFKKTLQMRDKTVEKNREILQVLNTCVVVGAEIMRRILEKQENEKIAEKEFAELRAFTNESVAKISKMYKCKVPCFVENDKIWYVTHSKF